MFPEIFNASSASKMNNWNTIQSLKIVHLNYLPFVLKQGTVWFYSAVIHPKDADRMENSADPDQTAPLGAV